LPSKVCPVGCGSSPGFFSQAHGSSGAGRRHPAANTAAHIAIRNTSFIPRKVKLPALLHKAAAA
jgi:hypothetical protein